MNTNGVKNNSNMRQILITSFLLLILVSCKVQGQISYTFDTNIVDSLGSGIRTYQSHSPGKSADLVFFLLVKKENEFVEFYLQEYSNLTPSGFLTLINSSNRITYVNGIKVPILFKEDVLSDFIKKDGITSLPHSGYYIKAIEIDEKYEIKETKFLF